MPDIGGRWCTKDRPTYCQRGSSLVFASHLRMTRISARTALPFAHCNCVSSQPDLAISFVDQKESFGSKTTRATRLLALYRAVDLEPTGLQGFCKASLPLGEQRAIVHLFHALRHSLWCECGELWNVCHIKIGPGQ